MLRRTFIAGIGSVASWPVVARAQQTQSMRRIGVFMNVAPDDPEAQARLAAFHQGLQELGWIVGRNVTIDYRWRGAAAADGMITLDVYNDGPPLANTLKSRTLRSYSSDFARMLESAAPCRNFLT